MPTPRTTSSSTLDPAQNSPVCTVVASVIRVGTIGGAGGTVVGGTAVGLVVVGGTVVGVVGGGECVAARTWTTTFSVTVFVSQVAVVQFGVPSFVNTATFVMT